MPIRVGNKEVIAIKIGVIDVPALYGANFNILISSSSISYLWIAESLTPVYHWSN